MKTNDAKEKQNTAWELYRQTVEQARLRYNSRCNSDTEAESASVLCKAETLVASKAYSETVLVLGPEPALRATAEAAYTNGPRRRPDAWSTCPDCGGPISVDESVMGYRCRECMAEADPVGYGREVMYATEEDY